MNRVDKLNIRLRDGTMIKWIDMTGRTMNLIRNRPRLSEGESMTFDLSASLDGGASPFEVSIPSTSILWVDVTTQERIHFFNEAETEGVDGV